MQAGRSGLWRRVDATGLERFALLQEGGEWTLRGTLLLRHEGRDFEAAYEVRCDESWHTRACDVRLRDGQGEQRLRLTATDGVWTRQDGQEVQSVRGALDVDLQWTPSTNALPIRRLQLGVGAHSGPVTAAWVRFPQLVVEPLAQEYRRLDGRRYRYSSAGGAFTADLEVDDDGLVTRYGRIWERVNG
jgi:uncharacterized protein